MTAGEAMQQLSIEEYDREQMRQNKSIIAIDFDGVIHNCDKGFHDGTIYGEPMQGSLLSIKALSSKGYKLIIYTCKANPTRPLVNNKNGIELICQWLKKYKIIEYIDDVVWGKPWAQIYIDDKGYRFENWKDTMNFLEVSHDLQ